MDTTGIWLTRKEVEARFGTSRERIRRAQRAGKLTSARPRGEHPNAEVEYLLEDLIAAGMVVIDEAPATSAGPGAEEVLRARVADLETQNERLLRMLEAALGSARPEGR